jgi:hypothetical protein
MTDETFLTRFEAASLPSFGHHDHLRVAFAYARRGGVEHAVVRARDGLRRFAAAHGEPGRYHDTLTTAWARVVGHYALLAGDDDFDAFLAAHPRLADRDLLSAHYSRERLFQPGRARGLRRARPARAALIAREAGDGWPAGRYPPAMAGRMTSTSPSPTSVSRPSSTRTSSSLR